MATTWSLDLDPLAQREAQQYTSPVPSREYILACLAEAGRPMTHEQLCRAYGMTNEDSIEALRRRLIAMERDGQLLANRRRAYALIDKLDLIKGRVQAHKDGFGFLIPEQGGGDYFLHNKQLAKVWHGDIVLAREVGKDQRGRKEAVIVEIIQRGVERLVGRLTYQPGGFAVVQPENPSIQHPVLIPPEHLGGAREGEMVQVDILEHPAAKRMVTGRISEVLGDFMAAGMEIEVALRSYNLPFEWPEAVQEQASQLGAEVKEEDKLRRVDVRDLPFVTIDGEDAKDFDDAVYCRPASRGGWKLWVAIADVSHYVPVDSPLDHEARQRATSVYFPGRVIPMLPEALSNGLCSLNPQVDRLCMVCEMNISAKGQLTRYRFYEGVMNSKARLTYTQVGALLETPDSEAAQALAQSQPQLVKPLQDLEQLYRLLRQARDERGAIDFETRETRIIFSADQKIERIVPVVRNDAHKIIEECMLCANVATARFLEKHQLAGLYRVHEGPKTERLETLRAFLGELGITLGGGDKPTPEDYQALFAQIRGRADAAVIQTMMLRSMQQAVYSPENLGHFGLSYPAYAHFTSPIRRYPDLLVHRALRGLIRSDRASHQVLRVEGQPVERLEKWLPYTPQQMVELGEHCSMAERRADEAVRDVMDWLKCEFLAEHVGEVFSGRITSVVGFGLFIELDEFYVEGLVHISALPSDYYHFEPEKQRLKGERTGRVWRLGDAVEVLVSRVNLDDRKIDFDLTEALNEGGKRRTKNAPAAKTARPARRQPATSRGRASGPAPRKKPAARAIKPVVAEAQAEAVETAATPLRQPRKRVAAPVKVAEPKVTGQEELTQDEQAPQPVKKKKKVTDAKVKKPKKDKAKKAKGKKKEKLKEKVKSKTKEKSVKKAVKKKK
ncbi:ribonuclease R [Marinospirillum sp.]|uniref:ribonuclease R n=1 Tax=Marinospirillum sp. TaxID=2183934 RepID=UPI003A8B9089